MPRARIDVQVPINQLKAVANAVQSNTACCSDTLRIKTGTVVGDGHLDAIVVIPDLDDGIGRSAVLDHIVQGFLSNAI